MSEFDITIRAKNREAATALERVVAANPDNFVHMGTVMVPGIPYELEGEGSLFDPVKEYLNENPTITVHDLKHNSQKTWEEQVRDLGAMILLSERALTEGNEVAREGMMGLYNGKSKGIPTKIRINKRGERIDFNMFQRGVIDIFKASFQAYAKEPELPKKRPSRFVMRPSEVRILIENVGLAGEKLPFSEIVESEGVKQLATQKSSAITRIGWNL